MTPEVREPATVVAPFFRNTAYLEPAVRSILALDYDPLEIILCDDASPDDAYEVVKRLVDAFDGPHEVRLLRNKTNLSMGIYNVLVGHASAQHIIVCHDDDLQRPDRVRRVMRAFGEYGASMVTSNAVNIRADGAHKGKMGPEGSGWISLEDFARNGRPATVQGAALNWHRDVLEEFGPIDTDGTARTSDYVIPFRAALLDGIFYLDEPLLERRVHDQSRGKIGQTARDRDVRKVEISSERITQVVYMMRTLDELSANGTDRHDIERLRSMLTLQIEDLARDLALHRNRLHMRALRMTWVPHELGPLTDWERFVAERSGKPLKSRLMSGLRSVRNRIAQGIRHS